MLSSLLYSNTSITLPKNQASSSPNQSVEICKDAIQRDHIHHPQSRAGASQDLAIPQDTKKVVLGVALLIHLKHDLGAHAWPDHDIQLQDGEQSGEGPIVRHVVPVNHVALATNEVADVGRELADPDAETR